MPVPSDSPTAAPPAPGLSTLAIHGDRAAADRAHGEAGAPVVSPLVQSVNFLQPHGTGEGLLYTRYGNTPNAETVQRRLALLEGAESALLLSSGMGATACAMLALLRPGDHLVSSAWIYGGTHKLLTQEFATLGIETTFVEPTQSRDWRRAVRPSTRAVFIESPVNPTTRVLDLRPLASLTHELGLALVIDSTFASPVNFRPLAHGADVVIHSATKYLNGHHDILGGVVLGTASYVEEVRQKMMVWGQAPDPFACWLLERGLKTLDVRVRRQNENALALARWCEEHPAVARVHYPGLASHPDHALAAETLDGFGGMMAIELAGGGEAADRFVRALRVITHATSLGGVDSLVCEPRYTSHAHMTSEARAAIGIPDGFLRISVGIENAEDLIADVEQALGA
ncbi:aminotransferase class I/II-fold pyridoxal phosphate-dependent enzyme [Roseisolibacter sp. H3M3-2]|uniref:trans-sulfuration enzyme family protein n=1 Tax=Roseisolibacter sp. H3M3-2 TaxID=3031323 RepID=UPI0023DCCA98|nr:aminotransferase class I/II-fold pyridoxal phosphate-dependent enzyme [Roseisolibacter sp. H3M3-2]MDF1503405.1 aminotransferase class I/II-fold pyridoxal phosphate-dependent enzyme [Roseisolibacter sp. H3M3-2]